MDQQQICTPQYIICLHLIENISAALYSHLSPPWTELIYIYIYIYESFPHSSLTTPHGTYTNLWFMQSKFPLHLSVITVWLRFSLLGSDIQFNQLTL